MGGQRRLSPFLEYVDLRWQLAGPDNYPRRRLDRVTHIVVHHSAGRINQDHSSLALARLHVGFGWPGIGYHFVVHWDGGIEYVGDMGTSRAHAGQLNEVSVGICIPGNFEEAWPTAAAIAGVNRCIEIVRLFCPGSVVVGHRDIADLTGYGPTACPGSTWPLWRPEIAA